MSEQVPPKIDGFDFVRCLGKGGMATVWEARQHDPDRMVAVKVLDEDFSSSPKDVDAFYAEAKTAALLDHPNIVTVFEVGCQSGQYYYVMELAAGYDIGKWLARKGRLAETDVLTVAESIGVALEFASRTLGLIHCDIKPANIMVDGDGTVRLTDMGIARFKRGSAQDDYITGTPQYMSPEQTLGNVALDERADIYSLGATMYHLLAGKPLFSGMSDDELMEHQRTGAAEDVRRLNEAVTGPCAVMLSRFLAKDRNDRPTNWGAAVALIRKTLELGEAPEKGHIKKIPPALVSFGKPSTMPLSDHSAPKSRHGTIIIHRGTASGEAPSPSTPTPSSSSPSPSSSTPPTPTPSSPSRRTDSAAVFWFWTVFAAIAAFAAAFSATRFL